MMVGSEKLRVQFMIHVHKLLLSIILNNWNVEENTAGRCMLQLFLMDIEQSIL